MAMMTKRNWETTRCTIQMLPDQVSVLSRVELRGQTVTTDHSSNDDEEDPNNEEPEEEGFGNKEK